MRGGREDESMGRLALWIFVTGILLWIAALLWTSL